MYADSMLRHFSILLVLICLARPGLGQTTDAPARSFLTGAYDLDDVRRDLVAADAWHPYPKAGEAGWDKVPEANRRAHVAAAEALLGTSWPELPATVFLEYVRTGNRSNFQALSYARRGQLAQLVIAEAMEDRGRFLDDIINGIWAICEETYWGVPAHLNIQQAGPGLPDVNEPTVDLFAAETAHLLAWTAYFLGDRLDAVSPLIRERIYTELDRRVLTPNLERDDFWWMSFGDDLINNWNPWVNGNWLTTVLLAESDADRRVEAVYKIMRSLDRFIDSYPEDGGCDEGPVYWTRAAGSMFDTLELLYSATDGAINLYDRPLIRNMGRYIYKSYIAGDYYINFADAGAKIHPDPSLVYRYGTRINDQTMVGFGAFLAREQGWGDGLIEGAFGQLNRVLPGLFSVADVRQAVPQEPLLANFWLPDIQVMGARETAGSRTGFYVAAKGGHNAESHNHNDIGNVIVYHDGQPVLIDVGAAEYTAKTFGPDRYTIWNMQSAYHNVPTINGAMQQDGRRFHARDVSFDADDRSVIFRLDLAGAYPDEAAARSWKRTVMLRRGTVTIRDAYDLERTIAPTQLNWITPRVPAVAKPGTLRLADDVSDSGAVLLRYDPKRVGVAIEPIDLEDNRLRSGWGDRIYRIVFSDLTGKRAGDVKLSVVAE